MVEEKRKGKNNGIFWFVIILLLIAVIGLGSYIYLNKDKISLNNSKCKVADKKTATVVDNSDNSVKEITSVRVFDRTKSVNSKGNSYNLACQGNAGIFVTVDESQKKMSFGFTPATVVKYYSLNWKSTETTFKRSTINFDRKIVDVYFGGMGQSTTGDTLFILMEDGTVEYIPIVHIFNNAQAEVISYGKIAGVSDVVKFVMSDLGSGVTTLAIKSDGSFYDLWYSLKDTGNY